jgi:hypothetical protein
MRAWLFCALKIRRRTRNNNRLIEFPFASVDACEIVFNSVRVDPPINPSRTTKDVRVEETPSSSSKVKAKLLAEITAVDARSLRSAVVGLIDSVTLVLETVERCGRESVTAREEI